MHLETVGLASGTSTTPHAYASTSNLLAADREWDGDNNAGDTDKARDTDTDSVRFGRKWEILQELDRPRPAVAAGPGTGAGLGVRSAWLTEERRETRRGQRVVGPDSDLDWDSDVEVGAERPREQDAGRVHHPEALPPGYDPSWRRD
jgi:hypothetical protein